MIAGWMSVDQPRPCHVVELGPGNGTLMYDMFRVSYVAVAVPYCLSPGVSSVEGYLTGSISPSSRG